MRLPAATPRPRAENTIALINVVFLLLVFFLVAGTISSQSQRVVTLARSQQGIAAEGDRGIVVLLPDGSLMWNGEAVDVDLLLAQAVPDLPLRIAADQNAPAGRLVALVADLRAAGFDDVAVLVSRVPGGSAQ